MEDVFGTLLEDFTQANRPISKPEAFREVGSALRSLRGQKDWMPQSFFKNADWAFSEVTNSFNPSQLEDPRISFQPTRMLTAADIWVREEQAHNRYN